MTTERSLFTLFRISMLIIAVPFLLLFFSGISIGWNFFVYSICIVCIGCLTYWREHEKTNMEKGITSCFVLSVLCFTTASWAVCGFLAGKGETAIADTWQTIGALAAAGLTGTAAFATLGTLLHLVKEKQELVEQRKLETSLTHYEYYREIISSFDSSTFKIENATAIYKRIFPQMSCVASSYQRDKIRKEWNGVVDRIYEIYGMFETDGFSCIPNTTDKVSELLKHITILHKILHLQYSKKKSIGDIRLIQSKKRLFNLFEIKEYLSEINRLLFYISDFVTSGEVYCFPENDAVLGTVDFDGVKYAMVWYLYEDHFWDREITEDPSELLLNSEFEVTVEMITVLKEIKKEEYKWWYSIPTEFEKVITEFELKSVMELAAKK